MADNESPNMHDLRKLFILPLVRFCPPQIDRTSYLEFMLHVHQRKIRWYLVDRPFRLPGKLLRQNSLIRKVANRELERETRMLVRRDRTLPEEVDVQVFQKSSNGRDEVFRLTSQEWDFARNFCRREE